MAKFKLHYRIMVTKQYGSGTTDNGKTRYTEWNRTANHTDTQLQPPEFSYICQKHTLEERKPLQQRVLGRQISIYQRFKSTSTSLAWYKNKFKGDQKSTIRPQTSKLSEEIISRIFQDLGICEGFLNGYR